MATIRQFLKILIVVAALAVVVLVVPKSGSFVILLATRAMSFAILAMSLDILLGFTGLASLGQAAYFGVGAYLTAILATKMHFGLGWDFWIVVLLGILLGAALAAFFGLFAIRAGGVYFLMITLAITPLRRLSGWHALIRFRRMLGLFTFFYATLHLLTWVVFVHYFDVMAMWEDVVMRVYITVGMLGFLAMLPLAVTSTNGWVKRLKFQRWQKLHRLVYVAAIAGVVHYLWLVKSDIREPLLYITILTALLGFRVVTKLRGR